MLDPAVVIEINRRVTGGRSRVTGDGELASALARPGQTFDGRRLHVTVFDQAAALLQGLVAAHAFLDGNKRTAWISTRVWLHLAGVALAHPDPEEAASFVESVATGAVSFSETVAQLQTWSEQGA